MKVHSAHGRHPFVQDANMTILHRESYIEYLKPGVKLDTWCSLKNSPLHSALFSDSVIAKADRTLQNLRLIPVLHSSRYYQPYQTNWPRCKDGKNRSPIRHEPWGVKYFVVLSNSRHQHGTAAEDVFLQWNLSK